jgi:hypothetical protein
MDTPTSFWSLFLTAVMLAWVLIAVRRSSTMWWTLLYLTGMILLGGLIGVGLGWFRGPEFAAKYAVLTAQLAGIGASLERVAHFKKSDTGDTEKA